MRKIQLHLLILVGLFATQTFSTEATSALFAQRGENVQYALEAADLASKLFNETTDQVAKGVLKTNEAEYIYFVGGESTSKEEKKKFHSRGMEAGKMAVALLSLDGAGVQPTSSDLKKELATAHYFYAINLGKWAEANGVMASLNRWPELKEHLDLIDSLDGSVQSYGASRTRARALHKLPFGNKKEALGIIKKAYEGSKSEMIDLSVHTVNVVYYLDLLVKTKEDATTFCQVYDSMTELSSFSDDELAEYNPDRVPESKIDIKNFLEKKEFEENIEEYYNNNCL